jgi:hypothetical protein
MPMGEQLDSGALERKSGVPMQMGIEFVTKGLNVPRGSQISPWCSSELHTSSIRA